MYLAVQRCAFHLREAGGEENTSARAAGVAHTELERELVARGEEELEGQVRLYQRHCHADRERG